MPDRRDFMAMAGAAALVPMATFAKEASPDLVIKGGRVIDPARRIDEFLDVAIAGGRIAALAPSIPAGNAKVVDAGGRLVLPGLIDIHTHGTVEPEDAGMMLAEGVTGWIEAGWQGADGYEPGRAAARAAPQVAGILLNIGRKGAVAPPGSGTPLELADVAAAQQVIAAHRDRIVGVKARLSRNIVGEFDREVLARAEEATRPFGIPVMIHIGDTYSPLSELLKLLKPGDIVTHMYAPPPHDLTGDTGQIIPEAIAARRRGVLFDWGNGTHGHLRWDVADAAVKAGFLPDTLSSDWTLSGHKTGMVSLPTVMSAALSLGIPLGQVVAMVTSQAARCFPLFRGRGTLRPGAPADVTVLDLLHGSFEFLDNEGNKRRGDRKLIAHATVLGGKLAGT